MLLPSVALSGLCLNKASIFTRPFRGSLSLFNKVALRGQRLAYTLSCISVAGIKYLPHQSSLEGRKVYVYQDYYSSKFQPITVEKSQREELKTPGHIVSVVEKRRSRNACLCSALFLYSHAVQDSTDAYRMAPLTVGRAFHPN